MLSATTSNHETILTIDYTREELKILKKSQTFFCPHCHQSLLLKIGAIKIPHFSHRTTCEQLFSEGESENHLLGKLQLYKFFRQHLQEVQLEAYIPQLRQRPDLLVNATVAIEFQCSSISLELKQKRTKMYTDNGYLPLWLLNTPLQKIKRLGKPQFVTLNHFEQSFIQNLHLMTYSPAENVFYYFSNLLHVIGNTYLTIIYQLPVTHQRFPFITPKILDSRQFHQYLEMFHTKYENFLIQYRKYTKKGVQDPILRRLYELRISPIHIPYYLAVPMSWDGNEEKNHLFWQLEVLQQLKNSSTENEIEQRHVELYKKLVMNFSNNQLKFNEQLYEHIVALWLEN
jgi:competence protein CoiA